MSYQIHECSPKAKAKIKEGDNEPAAVELHEHFNAKYPFGRLHIGQCFTVPMEGANEMSIRFSAAAHAKKNNKKFCVIKHKEHNLIEVARIA